MSAAILRGAIARRPAAWSRALPMVALVAMSTLLPFSAHAADDEITAATAAVALPAAPPSFSPLCETRKVAGESFKRPLRSLRKAIREKRDVRVLAIGSSSTAGVGASKPMHTYLARLEEDLEVALKGRDFEVHGRGLSGEIAEGAASRLEAEVKAVKPDLVVWQLGTNDAIRHIDLDQLKSCMRRAITWLRDQKIDVVLVDPQYGDKLTTDDYYAKTVAAIEDVAREMRVLLVDRFHAMKELSNRRGDPFYLTNDDLHLNDQGHRCMAEQLARAIVGGVLLAEAEGDVPSR